MSDDTQILSTLIRYTDIVNPTFRYVKEGVLLKAAINGGFVIQVEVLCHTKTGYSVCGKTIGPNNPADPISFPIEDIDRLYVYAVEKIIHKNK